VQPSPADAPAPVKKAPAVPYVDTAAQDALRAEDQKAKEAAAEAAKHSLKPTKVEEWNQLTGYFTRTDPEAEHTAEAYFELDGTILTQWAAPSFSSTSLCPSPH
jgi:hypothetical protein